jgi:hypothetical protein
MIGERTRFKVNVAGAEPLNYEWFKNGVRISSAANTNSYSFSNTQQTREGTYMVRVYNDFGEAISNEFTLTVIPFNEKPKISFITPADSTLYQAGQMMQYKASATDPEEGELDADRFEWFLDFHHDDHIHDGPAFSIGVKEGNFEIPDIGETSSNVWYKIRVKVKDTLGQETGSQKTLIPIKSEVAFRTEPPGLSISVDGPGYVTPFSKTFVEHLKLPVDASTQTLDGDDAIYRFSHWSEPVDGSFYVIPEDDVTLVAYFEKCTIPMDIGIFSYYVAGEKVVLHWEIPETACTEGFIIDNVADSDQYEIEAHPHQTYYEYTLPESLDPNTPYTFEIQAYNEYGKSSVTKFVLNLDEQDGMAYLFFPNPTEDQLTIKGIDPTQEFKLQFHNLSGQAVTKEVSWSVEQNDVIVDLSKLSSGLYFMSVETGGISKILKVMIN